MSIVSTVGEDLKEVLNHSYLDDISMRVPGDEYQSHDPSHPAPEGVDFKFYTMDLSYFSGKLEMYFRYKEITHERIEPTAREFNEILFANTGSEQLPQVFDTRPHIPPEHRWLRDTTPVIEYLERDERISRQSRPVLPPCPVQAFFQRLMEDYADEFLWRPAMWWRWEPSFDRLAMGHRFTYEFAREVPDRYTSPISLRHHILSLRQWLLSCRGEDVTTPAKRELLKQQYYELLDILQGILDKQPFLFGNHPTLVDFGFAGPFFRHFSSDFTPRKVMQQRAPAVYQWVATLWNCKGSRLSDSTGFPKAGSLPDNWKPLLRLLPEYLEYYHLNAKAYAEGKGQFTWVYRGESFYVPVVHYRAWCRQQLQEAFTSLDSTANATVESILREYGCWDLLWRDGVIDTPPECDKEPPFALYPPPARTKVHIYKWDFRPIFNKYMAGASLRLGIFAILGASLWWNVQKHKK